MQLKKMSRSSILQIALYTAGSLRAYPSFQIWQ